MENTALIVAISSRALFDFEAENAVFEARDDRAYMQLQLANLEVPAKAGVAFSLVRKLLAFNDEAIDKRVEVVVLSRNDPVSGMRVFRSCEHYGMDIARGCFTRGASPWRYLRPLGAQLFLSANHEDVRAALEAGVPAAQVYPHAAHASEAYPREVRIAFDGDAVLFSDEAERVFQSEGLQAFVAHEQARATQPLPAGPFKPLLLALQRLQEMGQKRAQVSAGAGAQGQGEVRADAVESGAENAAVQTAAARSLPSPMRLRTALVTARSAPAHERAIRTLMSWNIEIDEALFLGGNAKGEFLREFEPDFFFDDQRQHVQSAAAHVPAGHVAAGVINTPRPCQGQLRRP